MTWGGHLDLHVSRNRRWNHRLLVLMLVIAVTLIRWLLLLLVMLLRLLLGMRSDLSMGRGVRHCHGHSWRLWRHRFILLHLLAWLDFGLCHGGSRQFLMTALPTTLGSVLDLGMSVALEHTVSGLSQPRIGV